MPHYQWEINAKQHDKVPTDTAFYPQFGPKIISRQENGQIDTIEFNIFVAASKRDIYLLGNFNNWGENITDEFKFQPTQKGMYSLTIVGGKIQHGDPYLLLVDGKNRRDPGAGYFDSEGRSVVWDFEHPDAYKMQASSLDLINRSVKILQTELAGLVAHFSSKQGTWAGQLGSQVPIHHTYKFIAESGVIGYLAELGFNTIQFLPLNQSIDGDKWSFRYLVPFLHAIDRRYGTPDDLRHMVDTFHQHGIAVIFDFVISHVPFRDYKIFGLNQDEIGLQHWIGDHQEQIWFGEQTNWGTMRYNFGDEQIRHFIIEAALKLLHNYGIDGFRIDNVDGIMRHGENGDGRDRTGGRQLLRELNLAIYKHRPHAYVHLESHFFKEGEAKYLTLPIKADRKAIGATAYTSSRLTHYLHKEYMPKGAADITPWRIRDIIEEKEWGQSNSTVADFHNHDAAAGLMHGRATGSYAYDALILKNPELHTHAVGKIKVMESIISFGQEGRTLDLIQSHILQTGTFEHDSSIHWYLEMIPANKGVLLYKQYVNKLMDHKAFWPLEVKTRQYVSVDDTGKSLVIHRKKEFIVYINLASHMLFNYEVPVAAAGEYKLLLNSDDLQFAGGGRTYHARTQESECTNQFEYYNHALKIGKIAPYQVLVWQIIN